ncbi:hypothetical protein KCU62_g257, partial [Aureobasidium sp. EXF-3399]
MVESPQATMATFIACYRYEFGPWRADRSELCFRGQGIDVNVTFRVSWDSNNVHRDGMQQPWLMASCQTRNLLSLPCLVVLISTVATKDNDMCL